MTNHNFSSSLERSYPFCPSALPGRPEMRARRPRLGLSIKCYLPSPIARCRPAMLVLLLLFPLHIPHTSPLQKLWL